MQCNPCIENVINKLLLWGNSGVSFHNKKPQPIKKIESFEQSIKIIELAIPDNIEKVYNISNLNDVNYMVLCNTRRQSHGLSKENLINHIISTLEDKKNVTLYVDNSINKTNKIFLKIKSCPLSNCNNMMNLPFAKISIFMTKNNVHNFSQIYRNCIIQIAKTKPTEFFIMPRIMKDKLIKEYVYIISPQCKICMQNRLDNKVTYFHKINEICGICNFSKEDHKTTLEICPKLQTMTAKELEAISEFCTPCPGCSTLIELKEGCRKISCDCGTKFCHACGKQLIFNIQLGTYYNHHCTKSNKRYGSNVHDAYIVDNDTINAFRAVQQVEHFNITDSNPCQDHVFLIN